MAKDIGSVINKILEGVDVRKVLSEDTKEFACEFYVVGPGDKYLAGCSTFAPDSSWPPVWKGAYDSTVGNPGDIIYMSHKEATTNPIYWRCNGVDGSDCHMPLHDNSVRFVIPKNAKGKGSLYIDVVDAADPASDDIFLYIDLSKSSGWAKAIEFI